MAFATFMPGHADAPRRALAPLARRWRCIFSPVAWGISRRPVGRSVGAKRVIMISLVAASPFLAIAPLLDGWAFAVMLAIGGLLFAVDASGERHFRPGARAGQRNDGFLLDDGLRVGQRRIGVPIVGLAADRFGIEPTLIALSLGPIAAMLCALPLPARPIVHAASTCGRRDVGAGGIEWSDAAYPGYSGVTCRRLVRRHEPGRPGDHLVEHRGVRRHVVRPVDTPVPLAVSSGCLRARLALAAGDITVHARRRLPHPF